jgi:hypothetical protein
MKKIIINKCGYSVGIYGCSNEFFNAIAIDGDKIIGFTFSGLYGAESRIKAEFQKLGYEEKYIPLNTYGKLTRKDTGRAYCEYMVVKNLPELLEHGYIETNKEYRKKAGLSGIKK